MNSFEKMKAMKRRHAPRHVCHACGTQFCTDPPVLGTAFSLGKCECCNAEDVPCTETKSYGEFKQWPLPKEVDPWPLPETFDDLIEPVIQGFDFDRVHQAMLALNWKWANGHDTGLSVPSIDRMKQVAKGLLAQVVKSNSDFPITGTGGFYAEKINDPDLLDSGLVLRFIINESERYFGDYYEN